MSLYLLYLKPASHDCISKMSLFREYHVITLVIQIPATRFNIIPIMRVTPITILVIQLFPFFSTQITKSHSSIASLALASSNVLAI